MSIDNNNFNSTFVNWQRKNIIWLCQLTWEKVLVNWRSYFCQLTLLFYVNQKMWLPGYVQLRGRFLDTAGTLCYWMTLTNKQCQNAQYCNCTQTFTMSFDNHLSIDKLPNKMSIDNDNFNSAFVNWQWQNIIWLCQLTWEKVLVNWRSYFCQLTLLFYVVPNRIFITASHLLHW